MLPHDNYIMHFNKNHDPRNGQFTKGPGSSFNTSSKSVNNKNKLIPNAKYLKNYSGPAYFISEEKLSGSLKPRIPNNYFTKNGFEDSKTPRVSFAPSIDKCLAGLSQNVEGKIYYVYSPKDISKCEVYKPNSKAVPDSKITDELWITNPVEIAQIGKIKVTGNQGKEGKRFSYGNKTAELYDDWIYENLNRLHHDSIEIKEGDKMLPHDNYIMHFNKNHDPRNGQFTKGHGGSSSAKTNQPKKKMNPTLKKVLIGAGIATGVAAAAAGTYFISKHFNQQNSITKTVDNVKKMLFTKSKRTNRYDINDSYLERQGEIFIKGINKNKKINKYKLTGYKNLNDFGKKIVNGQITSGIAEGSQKLKDGSLNFYSQLPGDSLYMKNGVIKSTMDRNIYSHDVKKIGNAVVKRMLVKRGYS